MGPGRASCIRALHQGNIRGLLRMDRAPRHLSPRGNGERDLRERDLHARRAIALAWAAALPTIPRKRARVRGGLGFAIAQPILRIISLIRLYAGALDHGGPLRDFGLDDGGELR